MKTDFHKLVKHNHRLEGFKKLTNMILGAFRSIICIYRPDSKGGPFSLTSKFAFLARIKITVSLVNSTQHLQNTYHQHLFFFFSKTFINSAALEEQRLKIIGFRVHLL